MYHLRLVRGKSYWGIVKASQESPDVYVPERGQADSLAASGFFVLVNGEADAGPKSEKVAGPESGVSESPSVNMVEEAEEGGEGEAFSVPPAIAELQRMNKAELVAYAGKNGMDITGCKTKDAICSKIIEALARASAVRQGLRAGE